MVHGFCNAHVFRLFDFRQFDPCRAYSSQDLRCLVNSVLITLATIVTRCLMKSCIWHRTSYTDPEAAWLAATSHFMIDDVVDSKEGTHMQLDAGSFVLEMGGERFFQDLGSEDYSAPGYFGAER